jgi:hypothetical protein
MGYPPDLFLLSFCFFGFLLGLFHGVHDGFAFIRPTNVAHAVRHDKGLTV